MHLNKDILILTFEILWIATFTIGMYAILNKQHIWLILGLITLIIQHHSYIKIYPKSKGIFFNEDEAKETTTT